MTNIVWQKPDKTLAVTTLLDGDSPADHAKSLQAQGDIPSDWVAVKFSENLFPTEKQESWRWDGYSIIVDSLALIPKSVSRRQARLALSQSGLLDTLEAWIETQPQATRIWYQDASSFDRNNQLISQAATALGWTDAQLDGLFALAGGL